MSRDHSIPPETTTPSIDDLLTPSAVPPAMSLPQPGLTSHISPDTVQLRSSGFAPAAPGSLTPGPHAPDVAGPQAAGPQPPPHRRFGDIAKTRQLLFDNVLNAARQMEPTKNPRYSLHFEDVDWAGPDRYSIAEQKKALLSNRTLYRRLHGTAVLRDAEGNEVTRRKMPLARVPYLTDRGTFIVNGTEYSVSHQFRLRPGVYTRRKSNSELEAHVNPAKGHSHRVFLDPATGVFRIQMGQAKIPLLPLLKAMGVSEQQMRDTWGNELTAVNMRHDDPRAINKLFDKLVPSGKTEGTKAEAVAAAFGNMILDADTSRRTLGEAHERNGPEAMLAITRKLLAVNRGEQKPDDRDAMTFQQLLGPEDFFAERMKKSRNIAQQLLWRAAAQGTLDRLPSAPFDEAVQSVIGAPGLSQAIEEINPAELLDHMTRVTRMGPGGIPSDDSIPEEARMVQPSQYGFVDYVRSPECYDPLTEVMTIEGWKRWPEVTAEDRLACLVDDRLEFHRPEKLHCADYRGVMCGMDNGELEYLVTPNHRIWSRGPGKHDKYRFVPATQVPNYQKMRVGGIRPYIGDRIDSVEIAGLTFAAGDWAQFAGWWIHPKVKITADHQNHLTPVIRMQLPAAEYQAKNNARQLLQLLSAMGIRWSWDEQKLEVRLEQPELVAHLLPRIAEPAMMLRDVRCFTWSSRRAVIARLLATWKSRRRRTLFRTMNRELAEEFYWLVFSLGYAASLQETRKTDPGEGTRYVVKLITHPEIAVYTQYPASRRESDDKISDYYAVKYIGKVYCATVPGGLLYVRRNNKLGHWSGNSGRVGVDSRLARMAVKGEDGNIYTPVKGRDGQLHYKSPQELADAVVAFPGQMDDPSRKSVYAIIGGRLQPIARDKVDFEVPSAEDTFSPLSNLIPFKSMVKGQRASMGARFLSQALPLARPEAPLVQNGLPGHDGRSFEEEYASYMGAIRADQPARVKAVTKTEIVLQKADGTTETKELYENHPFARKTFLHQTPVVQPGDTVQPGQLLARSNFTDDNGATALGLNARVAYIPWGGLNFEDAVVVSKSFAQRATSEHMYQEQHEWTPQDKQGRNAFVSIFPSKYPKSILENFDDSGVIKPGTRVKKGDPLILVAREKELNYKNLLKGGRPSFQDHSYTWDHEHDGVVTDVVQTPKGAAVVVKASAPLQVGDKLAGRVGDKGIVSAIVDDDDMPVLEDGKPAELLLNSLGITSRTNPMQIVEAVLGKIAAQTGKPFKVPDFNTQEELVEFANRELEKSGLQDEATITDPRNGRKINNVLTGNRWVMKLHHTAEAKSQGRGLGAYTAEGTPAKGGVDGSKKVGMLELSALISHGVPEVIRDVSLVRGQADMQAMAQHMSGFDLPTPAVPYVYKKFVNDLKASGINVVRDGTRTHIMAMTRGGVDELVGDRELKNAETVDWATMKPIKGGLFDDALTGGHMGSSGGGSRWAYIKLHTPLINPVMEEPARRILGLTQKQFENVMAGREELRGKSGPQAIASALDQVDLDKLLEQTRLDLQSARKTTRDSAIRKLGYLKSAQRLGIHPRDWVLDKVPVLPPAFRPISVMGPKKLPLVPDANLLYKELFESNQALSELSQQLDDRELGEHHLENYKAFKAVTGLGDPTSQKSREQNVKGILKHVFGNSPKTGTVHRKLLGSTVDMAGRSVIAPDPNLDMDQVAIPEEQAWAVYRPHIVRRLVRRGMSRVDAARAVEERSPAARQAIVDEMDDGVVIINRAPTLHRFGFMAARPKLTKDHVMKVSPLVVGGFGADFDGDAMQYHVPTTEAAKKEALEKMLPSKNLLAVSNFQVQHTPGQEYVGGLYEATTRVDNVNKPLVFATEQDAVRAYQEGRIGIGRRVKILNQ